MTGEDQNDPTAIAGFTDAAEPKPESFAAITCSGAKPRPLSSLSAETLADLARSGLDADDDARMGIYEPDRAEMKANGLSRKNRWYAIPYFGPDGSDTGFRRYRNLDFVADEEESRGPKYKQTPGTAPLVYFPKCIDWTAVLGDPTAEIFFTEGEKSSYRASKAGIPCLGTGGCWSWSGKSNGTLLAKDITDNVPLKNRPVIIIAESDAEEKSGVAKALDAFGVALRIEGAQPSHVILPPKSDDDEAKVGVDDFLSPSGLETSAVTAALALSKFKKLERLSFDLQDELFWARERYAVTIYHPQGSILDIQKSVPILKSAFDLIAAKRTVGVRYRDAKGVLKTRSERLGKAYPEWKYRREYGSVGYWPGKLREIDTGGEYPDYNLWPGWACDSIEGGVSLWKELLDHDFQDAPAEDREWFEKWCASPIQHPGEKLFTGALIFGEQGYGKTLIAYCLAEIYGWNFKEINQHQLHGAFNEWGKHRQLVLAEEISNSNRKVDADNLKGMLTRRRITINAKFQPEYEIDDTINYIFCSNHFDAMSLENSDRRFFVHEVKYKIAQSKGAEIMAWVKTPAGAAALRYYFEHLDLTGFNPHAAAPMTAAKASMQDLSRGEMQTYARRIAKKEIDEFAYSDVWQLAELEKDAPKDRRLERFDTSLLKEGGRNLGQVRVGADNLRLWACRDGEHWMKQLGAVIAAEYLRRNPKQWEIELRAKLARTQTPADLEADIAAERIKRRIKDQAA
jgi:hypothetical protein